MKNTINTFASLIKGFALTVLLITSTFIFAIDTKTNVTTEGTTECSVTDLQVTRYLRSFGYEVYRLEQEAGSCNRIATTQYPDILVIVYIDGNTICCFEEVVF
jgi:hypothetical protein